MTRQYGVAPPLEEEFRAAQVGRLRTAGVVSVGRRRPHRHGARQVSAAGGAATGNPHPRRFHLSGSPHDSFSFCFRPSAECMAIIRTRCELRFFYFVSLANTRRLLAEKQNQPT